MAPDAAVSGLEKVPLRCRGCGDEPQLEDFLGRARGFWAELEVAWSDCPLCGTREYFRVAGGKLLLGYTYAAGAARFAPMEEVTGIPEVRARVTAQGWLLEAAGKAFLVGQA